MNDDELLFHLQAALAPDPTVRPPAATLIAMHRALDAATFPVRLAPTPRPRPRLFSIVVAACGVAAVTLGLLATTTSFSRAVREAAHDVGLPVDSPDLVDARARRDELAAAVERRDLVATATTLARLRIALTRLDGDELASLQPGVDQLIARAEAVLAPPPSTTSTTTSTSTTSTTEPATSVPIVAGAPPPHVKTTIATSPSPGVTPTVSTTATDDHSGPGGGASPGGPGPNDQAGGGGGGTGPDDGAGSPGGPGGDDGGSGHDDGDLSGRGQSGSGGGGLSDSGSGQSGSGSGGGSGGSRQRQRQWQRQWQWRRWRRPRRLIEAVIGRQGAYYCRPHALRVRGPMGRRRRDRRSRRRRRRRRMGRAVRVGAGVGRRRLDRARRSPPCARRKHPARHDAHPTVAPAAVGAGQPGRHRRPTVGRAGHVVGRPRRHRLGLRDVRRGVRPPRPRRADGRVPRHHHAGCGTASRSPTTARTTRSSRPSSRRSATSCRSRACRSGASAPSAGRKSMAPGAALGRADPAGGRRRRRTLPDLDETARCAPRSTSRPPTDLRHRHRGRHRRALPGGVGRRRRHMVDRVDVGRDRASTRRRHWPPTTVSSKDRHGSSDRSRRHASDAAE